MVVKIVKRRNVDKNSVLKISDRIQKYKRIAVKKMCYAKK